MYITFYSTSGYLLPRFTEQRKYYNLQIFTQILASMCLVLLQPVDLITHYFIGKGPPKPCPPPTPTVPVIDSISRENAIDTCSL